MLSYLFTTMCISYIGSPYFKACEPTLNAVSIHYSIKSTFDNVQNIVEKKIKDKTNDKLLFILGTYYSINQTHLIKFNSSIKPIADSISLEIVTTRWGNGNINITWKF